MRKLRQVLIILIRTKKIKKFILFIIILSASCILALTSVSAAEITNADVDAVTEIIDGLGDLGSPENAADSVNIIILLTIIALAPSILVLMTGFTRMLIVLSFVRNAMGLQQTPPTQVLTGIALFLTIFLMWPTFTQINDEALQPYINEEISMDEAFEAGMRPAREFMMSQVSREDINTFLDIADRPVPEEYDDIATEVLIPAFIMGEIKRAFIMGFFIYIPFLIIDLVVASTLMSLGMMMLPPAMVSMPFKLILFLLVDGWGLVVTTLIGSFYA